MRTLGRLSDVGHHRRAEGYGFYVNERGRSVWLFCLLTALAVLVAASVAFLLMLAPWLQDLRIAAEGTGILLATWFAVWLYQGYVVKRHEGLNGTADALSNFIDVFHPEQARSQRALREVHSKTIAPTPDDEDDPVRLVTNRDGTPRAVRIHRRA